MTTTPLLANPARVVFGGLGWCAVVLAAAGVVVPGLPTTVFVLAASYCFSKSSPRFAEGLGHPWWASLDDSHARAYAVGSAMRAGHVAGVLVSSCSRRTAGMRRTLGLGDGNAVAPVRGQHRARRGAHILAKPESRHQSPIV